MYDVAAVRNYLSKVCGGSFAPLLPNVSPSLDGKGLMKLSAKQMASIWNISDEMATQVTRWRRPYSPCFSTARAAYLT